VKVNFLRAMNVTAELPIWLFWNQILNIWLFLRHLAKSVFFWLFFNRKGLALAKHCLSCIFIANLFWRESITMQGAQILQRFYCCPKNVRLYLLKLTVRLSLQFFFFCSPLSVRTGEFCCNAHHHLCLHCWHLLWKEFHSLHFPFRLFGYLPKPTLFNEQSSADKQGLTVLTSSNIDAINSMMSSLFAHTVLSLLLFMILLLLFSLNGMLPLSSGTWQSSCPTSDPLCLRLWPTLGSAPLNV